MHSPLGMIKLNMFCAASGSYLTPLPYHKEGKSDNHFFSLRNGSQAQIWKPFSAIHNFTKSDVPEMLKDAKEIPMRHLVMTVFNSRKSGRHPDLE